jgi:hypothetical protein
MSGIFDYKKFINIWATTEDVFQTFPSDQRYLSYSLDTGGTGGWITSSTWATLIVDKIQFDSTTQEPNFLNSQAIGYFAGGSYTTATDHVFLPTQMYTGPIIPDARRNIPVTVVQTRWSNTLTGATFQRELLLIQNWEPGVTIGDPINSPDFVPILTNANQIPLTKLNATLTLSVSVIYPNSPVTASVRAQPQNANSTATISNQVKIIIDPPVFPPVPAGTLLNDYFVGGNFSGTFTATTGWIDSTLTPDSTFTITTSSLTSSSYTINVVETRQHPIRAVWNYDKNSGYLGGKTTATILTVTTNSQYVYQGQPLNIILSQDAGNSRGASTTTFTVVHDASQELQAITGIVTLYGQGNFNSGPPGQTGFINGLPIYNTATFYSGMGSSISGNQARYYIFSSQAPQGADVVVPISSTSTFHISINFANPSTNTAIAGDYRVEWENWGSTNIAKIIYWPGNTISPLEPSSTGQVIAYTLNPQYIDLLGTGFINSNDYPYHWSGYQAPSTGYKTSSSPIQYRGTATSINTASTFVNPIQINHADSVQFNLGANNSGIPRYLNQFFDYLWTSNTGTITGNYGSNYTIQDPDMGFITLGSGDGILTYRFEWVHVGDKRRIKISAYPYGSEPGNTFDPSEIVYVDSANITFYHSNANVLTGNLPYAQIIRGNEFAEGIPAVVYTNKTSSLKTIYSTGTTTTNFIALSTGTFDANRQVQFTQTLTSGTYQIYAGYSGNVGQNIFRTMYLSTSSNVVTHFVEIGKALSFTELLLEENATDDKFYVHAIDDGYTSGNIDGAVTFYKDNQILGTSTFVRHSFDIRYPGPATGLGYNLMRFTGQSAKKYLSASWWSKYSYSSPFSANEYATFATNSTNLDWPPSSTEINVVGLQNSDSNYNTAPEIGQWIYLNQPLGNLNNNLYGVNNWVSAIRLEEYLGTKDIVINNSVNILPEYNPTGIADGSSTPGDGNLFAYNNANTNRNNFWEEVVVYTTPNGPFGKSVTPNQDGTKYLVYHRWRLNGIRPYNANGSPNKAYIMQNILWDVYSSLNFTIPARSATNVHLFRFSLAGESNSKGIPAPNTIQTTNLVVDSGRKIWNTTDPYTRTEIEPMYVGYTHEVPPGLPVLIPQLQASNIPYYPTPLQKYYGPDLVWNNGLNYDTVYKHLTGQLTSYKNTVGENINTFNLSAGSTSTTVQSRSLLATLSKVKGTINTTSSYRAYYSGSPLAVSGGWYSENISLFEDTSENIEFNVGQGNAQSGPPSVYSDGGVNVVDQYIANRYRHEYNPGLTSIRTSQQSENKYPNGSINNLYMVPGYANSQQSYNIYGQLTNPFITPASPSNQYNYNSLLSLSASTRTASTGTSTNLFPIFDQTQGVLAINQISYTPLYQLLRQDYIKLPGRLNARAPSGAIKFINKTLTTGTSSTVLVTGAVITTATLTPRLVLQDYIDLNYNAYSTVSIPNITIDYEAHLPAIVRSYTYPNVSDVWTGYIITRTQMAQGRASTGTVVPLIVEYQGGRYDTTSTSTVSIGIPIGP